MDTNILKYNIKSNIFLATSRSIDLNIYIIHFFPIIE